MTRVLLTRPQASSDRFAADLCARVAGIETLVSPVIEIEHLSPVIDLAGVEGLVFTSAHAVGSVPDGVALPAFCVGDSTAHAAKARGLTVYSAGGTVDDLVRLIAQKAVGQLLYLRGAEVAGDLEARMDVASVVTYRQRPVALSNAAHDWLCGDAPVIVSLFSARTAAGFVGQLEPKMGAVRKAVCISGTVAAQCPVSEFAEVSMAKAPTSDAMVAAIANLTRDSIA